MGFVLLVVKALVLVMCRAYNCHSMHNLEVTHQEKRKDTKVDDHLYVRAFAADTGRHVISGSELRDTKMSGDKWIYRLL